jgi:hypothetical protein
MHANGTIPCGFIPRPSPLRGWTVLGTTMGENAVPSHKLSLSAPTILVLGMLTAGEIHIGSPSATHSPPWPLSCWYHVYRKRRVWPACQRGARVHGQHQDRDRGCKCRRCTRGVQTGLAQRERGGGRSSSSAVQVAIGLIHIRYPCLDFPFERGTRKKTNNKQYLLFKLSHSCVA